MLKIAKANDHKNNKTHTHTHTQTQQKYIKNRTQKQIINK